VLGTLIYWAIGITIIIVFLSVALEYIPDDVKKWIKKKLLGGKKSE